MSEKPAWNDELRDQLRETLRLAVLGELRLARHGRDEILRICREVYILDECPDDDIETFVKFAAETFERIAAEIALEKASWPAETDCDRLDRVEAALRERGILLWQVSPCCDTCTHAELAGRIDAIEDRHPGFRNRVRGFAFFIDQNMPQMLAVSSQLSIYLGYGWFAPGDAEVPGGVDETNALAIAREVCECFRAEGFEADWNGRHSRKIGVALNWQRRTPLDE